MAESEAGYDGFRVARWVDALGGFISRRLRLWIALGNLESRLVADELDDTALAQPIYISGVARAGSTILLETLAQHPDLASHRYRDYPPVFTPYWWNRFLEHVPQRDSAPAERTHRDGIAITPESPEAFEEVIWMAFFSGLHDPARSAVLPSDARHPEFEAFYRDHIRKLVRIRGGKRYLSKDNYIVSRLEYLLKLFPDARFVIPVRDPAWHIASLMKQHALFCAGEQRHPEALRHMQRVGHFEFGLDRRAINVGDPASLAQITDAWASGDEVEGWARYWAYIYGHMADRLVANPALRDAALVVRFEELCRSPRAVLDRTLAHCRLDATPAWLEQRSAAIRFPSYYQPGFAAAELATIERHTADTAARFGYPGPSADRAGPMA
ncbi:MAG TPA: sulfotransferase [Geminicoccaceae bacterium]|nr:sulfotransferase [Geminicoccaceae bacterium]